MKLIVLILIGFSTFGCVRQNSKKTSSDFSLHLFQEPLHLDPARLRGSSASYFFYNTLRGLYRIDKNGSLAKEGGECQWIQSLQLQCRILGQKWSDGSTVTAQDYVRSLEHLVSPGTASPRSDLLINLKNAKAIIQGTLPPTSLGVTAIKTDQLLFDFISRDSEFLYKLASTAMFPTHKNHKYNKLDYKTFIGNGPYQISKWEFGRELRMEANPHYNHGHENRPPVLFYFIDDEMTAFRLFQRGELSFLRRIPSKMVDQVNQKPEFYRVPMARFDYIGFGPSLAHEPSLRKALVHSVDYDELKKILKATGRPGCPSLPSGWIDSPPCFDFNLKKAKEFFTKVEPAKTSKTFQLWVSQQGGNDIKQQAEYFQNQWKKNLGLKIEIKQIEQKVFLSQLHSQPPDIFRKGVGLDRPTCLDALETFSEEGKQNFIQWDDKNYLKILQRMTTTNDRNDYKTLCRKAVQALMEQASILPLGEMHFSIMASPKFSGWSLNSMNQLDLSQLHRVNHKNKPVK